MRQVVTRSEVFEDFEAARAGSGDGMAETTSRSDARVRRMCVPGLPAGDYPRLWSTFYGVSRPADMREAWRIVSLWGAVLTY